MMAFDQIDAETLMADVPGINRTRQEIAHPLLQECAMRAFRIVRLVLQEALDLDRAGQASCRKPFQRFGDDRSHRFIAHQQLAVPGDLLITVADRGLKHPIAIHHPPAHAVLRLLAVLFTLVLRHTGQ
ncbi:MAG: hypothetical protein ROR55_28720 [Devosia sp.]